MNISEFMKKIQDHYGLPESQVPDYVNSLRDCKPANWSDVFDLILRNYKYHRAPKVCEIIDWHLKVKSEMSAKSFQGKQYHPVAEVDKQAKKLVAAYWGQNPGHYRAAKRAGGLDYMQQILERKAFNQALTDFNDKTPIGLTEDDKIKIRSLIQNEKDFYEGKNSYERRWKLENDTEMQALLKNCYAALAGGNPMFQNISQPSDMESGYDDQDHF